MTKTKKKKKPPRSLAELSTLDDFQGTFEEFQAIAIKEVLDWQAAQSVKDK